VERAPAVPRPAGSRSQHRLLLLARLPRLAGQCDIGLQDFGTYDHQALGYSWDDVINDPDRKMGHGFVLAMMIEGVL
jgi:hypothetical protein